MEGKFSQAGRKTAMSSEILEEDPATPAEPTGDKKDDTIPYSRFQEVNNEKKEAVKEAKELKEKLSQYEKAEAEKSQKELESKGQYEQVIKLKDEELAAVKKDNEVLQFYKNSFAEMNKNALEAFKTKVGEEQYNKLIPLLDLSGDDDPRLVHKINAISDLVNNSKPAGGVQHPTSGIGKTEADRYQELKQKVISGTRLSGKEEAEMISLGKKI